MQKKLCKSIVSNHDYILIVFHNVAITLALLTTMVQYGPLMQFWIWTLQATQVSVSDSKRRNF